MTKNKFWSILLFGFFIAQNVAAQGLQNNEAPANDSSKLTFDKVDSSRFYGKAVLQILNKTTAKTSIVEVSIGSEISLGKLSVKVDKCWQAPLDQKPDSRVLMQIFEEKITGEKARIFYGWMISSSPSISSLEHPIYDVAVLSCKSK